MPFVGGDIQAALGAGMPELVFQLDGTLDLGEPAVIFGVGAEMGGFYSAGGLEIGGLAVLGAAVQSVTAAGAMTIGGIAVLSAAGQGASAAGVMTIGGLAVSAALAAANPGVSITGWSVPISSGLGNPLFPRAISYGNDLAFLVGPIEGLSTSDGTVIPWPGSALDGWIAATEGSDVPLGGLAKSFTIIPGTSKSVWAFNATEIATVLAAAGPLVSGSTRLYAIVRGTNDFRRAVPLVYRSAPLTA